MIVLPGVKDRISKSGKSSGSVLYFHGGKVRRLATVYGDTANEMRRNKYDVADRLRASYVTLWCEEGRLMSDGMRAALRVLRVLGPRTFALVVCKSTVRALFKRGIINSDLSINTHKPNVRVQATAHGQYGIRL